VTRKFDGFADEVGFSAQVTLRQLKWNSVKTGATVTCLATPGGASDLVRPAVVQIEQG
jgi:hypothetical protein